MKKNIYIMISQTGTNCSKIFQLFTRAPYNHASIALDEDLNSLYSFARQNLYIPLIAGFVKEDVNEGVYKSMMILYAKFIVYLYLKINT